MKKNRSRIQYFAFALAALTAATAAVAQEYPSKAVTLIAPTAPASAADLLARAMAPRLSARLGQAVVVENRTGASGNIGIALVARSPADGHTLLVTPNTIAIAPALQKNVGYDPLKDFAPITRLTIVPLGFVTKQALPVNTVAEFVALAKSKPRALNYATPGNGTPQHLEMEHFKQLDGIDVVHVPFSAASGAMNELLAGRVDVAFVSLTQALPQVREGRLRLLGVASDKRNPLAPQSPTFAEQGLEALDSPWVGMLAPGGTHSSIVTRLARDVQAIFETAEVQETASKAGMVVAISSPAGLASQIQNDLARWRKVIDTAGIKPD